MLDGWGIGPADHTNAIHLAALPVMERLRRTCPYTQLWTHGHHVGLPGTDDLGGSEVGHMTMGAGRVMEQGPALINNLIRSGELFENACWKRLVRNSLDRQTPLHLLGLLSDGNIHSHISHTEALIRHAFSAGIKRCYLHALLDGRDVPVQSAHVYTERVEGLFRELRAENAEIDYAFASGGGREAITMDRDNNWSKVEAGWQVHVRGESENRFPTIGDALTHFRDQIPGIIDQDLPGFVITRNGEAVGPIADGHSALFTNFRADRALEFSRALLEEDFPHFNRGKRPEVTFAGMMQYDLDDRFPPEFLAGTPTLENPFGRRILELGMKQFRLTETQKFPHVTFFYNGGYREPLDRKRETYHLIASDKVESFARTPAMKAREIGAKAVDFIRSGDYDYGLINFANADMVGHTGDLRATVKAVEIVDETLGCIVREIDASGGMMVITADHGNADEMLIRQRGAEQEEPSTKHSLNPVPFLIYDPLFKGGFSLKSLTEGQENNLSHVAATNFILLGLPVPDDLAPPLFC